VWARLTAAHLAAMTDDPESHTRSALGGLRAVPGGGSACGPATATQGDHATDEAHQADDAPAVDDGNARTAAQTGAAPTS
jgi:hypothetical protein